MAEAEDTGGQGQGPASGVVVRIASRMDIIDVTRSLITDGAYQVNPGMF
jgi:hypothetical protein